MTNKIALCTTFPNALDYPQQTIPTWLANLPKDMLMLIGLDPCQNLPKTEQWLIPAIKERTETETCFISRNFQEEQIEFLKRNKEKGNPKDYRLDYVRFSFKVFTLEQSMIFALERGLDYLVWLDADVMIKKPLDYSHFEKWLPKDKVATYLGRKDWDHSECGFMIFNLKNGGKEFIARLKNMYVTDEVLTLPQWHDSYVFDRIRDEFNSANGKDVFNNLTSGIPGRDVFDDSVLKEFMEHKKGNRKFAAKDNGVIDLNQLVVKTQNCVNHEIIQKNVTENLKIMPQWLDLVKPHAEEIVIANAGPSLNPEEIRPFYEKGIKIAAVKHALGTLLDAGITPWACILLDPREHVKDFVKHPKAKDVLWFVASMVDPEVTKVLLAQGCRVYGYHAYVGAEEHKLMPKEHLDKLVMGGSATCTRGIGLLRGMLKFKTFHLFGYDLCSLEKPDMTLKKGDRPIWIEVVLESQDYDKKVKRKFFTKGEFLAQVQELRNFFNEGLIKFEVYGDPEKGGIIPWVSKCLKSEKKFLKDKKKELYDTKKSLNSFFSEKSKV